MSLQLVEPDKGRLIDGIDIPKQFYWVLDRSPFRLAGMKYPQHSFPWSNLEKAGLSKVVALQPGIYNPAPLEKCFDEHLEDLFSGDPPIDRVSEKAKIKRAVAATIAALHSGEGIVIHCVGGRGRTGTVLGCVLRELGFESDEAISYLDRVHRARGKPGWPEAPWQETLIKDWQG